jgi:hypothetical protein
LDYFRKPAGCLFVSREHLCKQVSCTALQHRFDALVRIFSRGARAALFSTQPSSKSGVSKEGKWFRSRGFEPLRGLVHVLADRFVGPGEGIKICS